MSTKRRTMGVHSQPRPIGANGEKLCFNCKGPLPKGRPYNCSSKCSDEWSHKTSSSILRAATFRRDKGICAECGTDTEALKKQAPGRESREARWAFMDIHGIPHSRSSSDWWDADHIKPVIEGGGECTLENIRTLCIPCHKEATAALAARRAEERKKQKVIDRDEGRGLLAGLL